ncbi:MAG TPA: neprosin family prolyl endopeptidase [Streptosporangiaceae bacterium]|nr:neprosin family prolyl endopeptidase [Streptosporangiaceae bacterium]
MRPKVRGSFHTTALATLAGGLIVSVAMAGTAMAGTSTTGSNQGTARSTAAAWLPDVVQTAQLASAAHEPKGMPAVGRAVPDVRAAGSGFWYADANQHATSSGGGGTYLVEDPTVAASDFHSLGEVAVQSADGKQIVEEGWIVARQLFGDILPHLFVFHWVNGVATCYDGCGFVSTSTVTTAGMTLPAGSTQRFIIKQAAGQWRVMDNGTEVGYFPDSLWRGSYNQAGLTQWFGEVAAGETPPCSQMGDGQFASAPSAASIKNITLVHGPAVSISLLVTNPAYYSVQQTSSTSIRFGGPGGCA